MYAMDGARIDRDSDLGDDSPMSHVDEHSDREDDMRDCDSSDEGVNVNSHTNGTGNNGIDYSRSPDHNPDNHLSHTQFGPNHPLGMLGNFMGMQGLPNLQHNDVLEKLKMQVRDMKDPEYPLHSPFGGSIATPPNTAFNIAQSSNQPQNLSQSNGSGGFPFTPPNAPKNQDGNPGSNSSTSSETSNSSQQNNGWSFEEQFKQVRQLYEINDDPKRKEFLDDLFSFMQKRGTPINRLPIMAKSVLDLYELYNLVIARGGLVDVINKKLWQEIIKGLHLPSSITSAAFTLRTQYMKYLYPYECEKKNLSTPAELQAAIDGNRREGRRSSYGQFDTQMQNQLQMPRPSPVANNLQMSPHMHRLMGAPPNLVSHEIEQRMMEYIKLFQTPKEPRRNETAFPGSPSPDMSRDAQYALEMSRVALWSMYSNNTSPPTSTNTASPPGIEPQREALNLAESPPPAQQSIPTAAPASVKRERDHPMHSHHHHHLDFMSERQRERERDFGQPPPAKRAHSLNLVSTHEHRERSHSPPPSHLDRMEQHDALDVKMHRSSTPTPQHAHHHNGNQELGGSSPSTSSSSINTTTLLSGMQFKVASKTNSSTGEQQLVVSLEMNGVTYEGVLFANATSNGPMVEAPASASKSNPDTIEESSRAQPQRTLLSS